MSLRKFLIFTAGVFVLLAASSASAIEITEIEIYYDGDTLAPECVKAGDEVRFVVTMKGADDSAFVGISIIDPEGDEFSLDVAPVICYSDTAGKSTFATASLITAITEEMNSADSSAQQQNLRIVARLWDTRVIPDECERLGINGKVPCDWCRRYGYHMEDPVGLAITRQLPPYCNPPVPTETSR